MNQPASLSDTPVPVASDLLAGEEQAEQAANPGNSEPALFSQVPT